LGLVVKKTSLYQERDEVERATFQSVVAQIPPEHIIWVDETGIEQQMHRPYAREIIGKRAFSNISGKRVPRTTLIAGYVQGRLTAPMHFKGTTDTQMFNMWIENMLLPELKPHHVVIMDNATFHRSEKTKELIESKGATLLFQPKYSPDLNKIEPQWANLKHHIKSDQGDNKWIEKLEKYILKMCKCKVS
jgi:transposase